MSEFTIPVAALDDEGGVYAALDFVPGADVLPRVDAARGVFITSKGDEIELSNKSVSALIAQQIQSQGKPDIPKVEVLLLGKYKQLEANPQHPGYIAALAEWEEKSNLAVLRYLCVVGVKGQAPAEFVEEHAVFFPNATATEMKYLWVASRIPDDDLAAFTEAVMGQGAPTAKGLETSAAAFRSES